MENKKRVLISVLFLISLMPMLLPQYGGCRGVQEISGLTNLLNPIGIISFLLFFTGIFTKRKFLGLFGTIGIFLSEIYEFLTWHIMTISGHLSLDLSLKFAYPEFYVGLFFSLVMIFLYIKIIFLNRNKA